MVISLVRGVSAPTTRRPRPMYPARTALQGERDEPQPAASVVQMAMG